MTLISFAGRLNFLIKKGLENIKLTLITNGLEIITKECLQWQPGQEKQLLL